MVDKGRTVAILSNWSISNQLFHATVLPQVYAIIKTDCFDKLLLLTLERDKKQLAYEKERVKHIQIIISPGWCGTAGNIVDSVCLPEVLNSLILKYKVNILIAHGAPAGALAYKVYEKSRVPFYVSSFEPHADYMKESRVWKKHSLKYWFQNKWEEHQKRNAAGLMPVAENYKKQLLKEGVSGEKIFVVPCTVDLNVFRFDEHIRVSLRLQLAWEHNTIGIYVGKYGGLYYEQEAFRIYKRCFETIPDFRLIILSPQPKEEILQHLEQSRIEKAKVYIASVPHTEVPGYLSAADFAFATIKSYPSARYCSPVKTGEYWACGLPVLLTEGVGDDSDIIKQEGGGATYNLQEEGSLDKALQQIQEILKDPAHRQEIPKLAHKYRSPERIREAYEYFFGQSREQR